MTRLLLPLVAILAASGCIIYDEDIKYAEKDDQEVEAPVENTDPLRPETPGTEDGEQGQEEADGPALTLIPDAAVVGETVIVTILVNDGADIDLTEAAEVKFFGDADVEVLATLPRGEGELIVTLVIPEDAPEGTQDLLIELDDGSAEFLADAFLVVTDVDDLPDDAWDGLPDSSTDGADGGGGSGDGTGGGSGSGDNDGSGGTSGDGSHDGGGSGDGGGDGSDEHPCP